MCACENAQNRLSRLLLERAGALTATGVVATFFIATSEERQQLLLLARGAIAEQREVAYARVSSPPTAAPTPVKQKVSNIADHSG
jgi:hypothetical protein